MNRRLIDTLKAWPVITLVAIALCYITGEAAELFGVSLGSQAMLELVRQNLTYLAKRMCGNAGWHWYFFNDLWALSKIILSIVVVAPIVEECIFRWALWSLPRPALPVASAVTSSLLFTGAHYLQMPWPDNAFVALFFFGMAQCWLYRKTERLWCPILNHVLFNAVNMVLVFLLPEAC